MWHTAFEAIGEINTPDVKADQDWTKVMIDHWTLSEGRESPFIYSQWATQINIDFRQMWGKRVTLVGWFHSIGRQYIKPTAHWRENVNMWEIL